MAPGIKSLFPAFDPSSIFTDIGWDRFQVYGQAGGCNPLAVELLTGIQLLNEDWKQNKFVQQYVLLELVVCSGLLGGGRSPDPQLFSRAATLHSNSILLHTHSAPTSQYVQLTPNGGKQIGGPLLVIQEESNPNMNINTTSSAVEKLVQAFPKASVEYVTLPGITHTPSLDVSQRLWLNWIDARFAGAQVTPGYQKSEASGFSRKISSYASEADWIIAVASEPIQISQTGLH